LAVLGYLRVDEVVPLPELYGIPIPTWLLLGGAAAGIALAFLARLVNGAGASRRARAAGRSLRAGVDGVAQELVVAPVENELAIHARLCAAVETARGKRRPGH
ncbi:MAG: GTP-binding protein HSR1, partial [Actinobacteria bacterium]|nr:GTP-binding protein HSR1 [Actinomycetota bacterium]